MSWHDELSILYLTVLVNSEERPGEVPFPLSGAAQDSSSCILDQLNMGHG